MRALILLLSLTLIGLLALLWVGTGGHQDIARLESRVEQQLEENKVLDQRNRELQAEVEDLRERLEAIEERARTELGLIRDDEEFYQVVPAPRDKTSDNGDEDSLEGNLL